MIADGGRFDGGRPGGRARRGDVRAAVLSLLAERPMHGYEMIQAVNDRTGGAWKPSPGSVYPTLALLEDEGLISSKEKSGRKEFALTGAGRKARAHTVTPWTPTADADPARQAIREAMQSAVLAAKQVIAIGTKSQQADAVALIAELRRKLYLLLAE